MAKYDKFYQKSNSQNQIDQNTGNLNSGSLVEEFAKRKADMELIDIDSVEKQSINQMFVKMDPEVLFECYLRILELNSEKCTQNDFFKNIQFDEDDTYSLTFSYLAGDNKCQRIYMAMDFYSKTIQKTKETFTVINFRKTRGCRIQYQKGLDEFKK